ncbi:MAG: hypothetical protein E7353_01730 [Clostridiales bacterium]|nr:hypothetical protein [Clostridiales bacterium]
MFGYVVVDKEKLTPQENALYRAFYCGVCKTVKQEYGNLTRVCTTYDITFLSILSHDCLNYPVQLTNESCIANPFQKKLIVKDNPLMRKVSAIAVLLVYYKLQDDIIDGKKSRKILNTLFSKQVKKAKLIFPEADTIIDSYYQKLREMERANEKVIDKVSDCFGRMLKEIFELVIPSCDENVYSLAYNVGKYIYLIDAVDDIEDDAKSGNYNPFIASYGEYKNKVDFMQKYGKEMEFSVYGTINKAICAFNDRSYNQSYLLLKNIMHYGLKRRADDVFAGRKPQKI